MTFSQQYRAICRFLSPGQKLHARQALIHLIRQRGFQGTPYLIRQSAASALRLHFPFAKEAEIDALTFYMLARLAWAMSNGAMTTQGTKSVVSYEAALANREMLADKAASIEEMSESDMLQLQLMMDKKNQLELTISNVMKAGYEGGQAAIDALKAS